MPCTVRHCEWCYRIEEIPTAHSSSDSLLDKLQFNDGGGDCFFHFSITFYSKGVAFILHIHKIKQVLIMRQSLPPPPSEHPECSNLIEQKNKNQDIWFQNFNKKARVCNATAVQLPILNRHSQTKTPPNFKFSSTHSRINALNCNQLVINWNRTLEQKLYCFPAPFLTVGGAGIRRYKSQKS